MQAHEAAPERRLAAARLADEAERLARRAPRSDTPSTACTRATSRRSSRCPTGKCFVTLVAPRAARSLASRRELRVDRRARGARASLGDGQVAAVEMAGRRALLERRRLVAAGREGVRAARREARSPAAGRAATAAGPRSWQAVAAAAGRCAGSSRAAPTCRGAAASHEELALGASSTIAARRTSRTTRSAMSATTPRSWVISTIAEPKSRLQLPDQRRGSAPGS